MNSRRHALAQARRFRTCPPPASTGLAETDPQIQAHRRRCPLCADIGIQDPWQTIAGRIRDSIPAADAAVPVPPAPGHLAAVKAERARWQADLFYSPPVVLVLSVSEAIAGAVQVAQVYHDLLLAGPGDLIIQAPPDPAGPFFIECWNRYTLRAEDLSAPLAVLSPSVVRAAVEMSCDPTAVPPWAPLPVPMTGENDPRLAFRRMEVEVGFVFASEAAATIMEQIEPTLAPAGQVESSLQRLVPGARWRSRFTDPEKMLAAAEMPDDFYPLAAAGEGLRVFGRRIDLADGRPARIFPFIPRVDHIEALTEIVMAITGTIDAFPDREKKSRLLAAFVLPGQAPIPCTTVDWDPGTGFFYLEIAAADIRQARIEITLLAEPSDD